MVKRIGERYFYDVAPLWFLLGAFVIEKIPKKLLLFLTTLGIFENVVGILEVLRIVNLFD